MRTRCGFNTDAFQSATKVFGIPFEITVEQYHELQENDETQLDHWQIEKYVEVLCRDTFTLDGFVRHFQPKSPDLAMSLFVINDDIRKIMERKEKMQDRLLPMVTIPWFYWKETAVTSKNPFGVVRDSLLRSDLQVNTELGSMQISGIGGDFSGIVEGRIAQGSFTMLRPIAPEFSGPKEMVPYYKKKTIEMIIHLENSTVELYPKPNEMFDYSFSESPKIYFYHGLRIAITGDDVSLKIGGGKWNRLRGDVEILIGRRHESPADQLVYHVWLIALYKLIHQIKYPNR